MLDFMTLNGFVLSSINRVVGYQMINMSIIAISINYLFEQHLVRGRDLPFGGRTYGRLLAKIRYGLAINLITLEAVLLKLSDTAISEFLFHLSTGLELEPTMLLEAVHQKRRHPNEVGDPRLSQAIAQVFVEYEITGMQMSRWTGLTPAKISTLRSKGAVHALCLEKVLVALSQHQPEAACLFLALVATAFGVLERLETIAIAALPPMLSMAPPLALLLPSYSIELALA